MLNNRNTLTAGKSRARTNTEKLWNVGITT